MVAHHKQKEAPNSNQLHLPADTGKVDKKNEKESWADIRKRAFAELR